MSTTAAFPGLQAALSRSGSRLAIAPADFRVIADLVRARSGIVLGQDKAYLVESRLEQIVRKCGYSGLAEIAARIRTHPNGSLAQDIIEALTTNETLFFRDRRPFEHLRRHLQDRHAACPTSQPLR